VSASQLSWVFFYLFLTRLGYFVFSLFTEVSLLLLS